MTCGNPCHVEAKCFARMRGKGSRFILGVWGLRLLSPDVAQPFATVRLRSREARMAWATPMASFAKGVHFGCFKRRVASLPVAGIALCDIQFHNVSKVVVCGRRNTSASLSEDEVQFSSQAQHFGDLHRHSAWQAQHFRRAACFLTNPRFTFYTPHFTLHTLHLTRCTLQSALHILHSVLRT